MDWRAKVELFEEIRREYEFGVGTIKGVARKLNVHRRMVREAIGNAVPAPRKKIEQRRSKLTAYTAAIDYILQQDRRAPRKQRHTAHRIWERLRAEVPGFDVCERSVRKYVEKRKQELGLAARETCVPQSYEWGAEAQVDWYEAWAELAGEIRMRRAMRLPTDHPTAISKSELASSNCYFEKRIGRHLRETDLEWFQMPEASDRNILEAALEGLEIRRRKLDEQISEVKRMIGAPTSTVQLALKRTPARKARTISAAGRKRIAEATRKRWAAYRAQQAATKKTGTKTGKNTAAAL